MSTENNELKIISVSVFFVACVAFTCVLYWLRPIAVPLILAVFSTIILKSAVDFLKQRIKCPRILAILLTLFFALTIIILLVAFISSTLGQFISNADFYQSQLEELFRSASSKLNLQQYNIDLQNFKNPLIQNTSKHIGGIIFTTISDVMLLLSKSSLVIIFILFLLLGKRKEQKDTNPLWNDIESRTKRYIVTKLITSASTGLLVGLTFFFLGIEPAGFFGLAAFGLNFIPTIGSVVATILPLPIVFLNPEVSSTVAILAIAIPTSIQILIGNIIEPKIMSDALGIDSPITILVALIFWGMLWGILGMVLAVPITAILKMLILRFKLHEPFQQILQR